MFSTAFSSSIPVYETVPAVRKWRESAFESGRSVGFVPTMGALHEGHLSLVRESLRNNDNTVVSIFVNPAQFAPREDLSTYPRTLENDLALLSKESPQGALVVFLPSVGEMYPSGIVQDKEKQKGTFVEVKGYDQEMEGGKRPTFFRGVATVVLKLFNIVQPTRAYFGQKDIQQALLLRRLCKDLHLVYPSVSSLIVVPTCRDKSTGLAHSSRNAYLSPLEMKFAHTLYSALNEAKQKWDDGCSKGECVNAATYLIANRMRAFEEENHEHISTKVDYILINDPETLEELGDELTPDTAKSGVLVLSGAMWVGKTRLIDNILLGDENIILGKGQ